MSELMSRAVKTEDTGVAGPTLAAYKYEDTEPDLAAKRPLPACAWSILPCVGVPTSPLPLRPTRRSCNLREASPSLGQAGVPPLTPM